MKNEIIDELISLTKQNKLKWMFGTPMGYFETRYIVISEKHKYTGTEVTVFWTTPVNYVNFSEEEIDQWSRVEHKPVDFVLWSGDIRGERVNYQKGTELLKLVKAWLKKDDKKKYDEYRKRYYEKQEII
jgi:hypothetical protein